MNDGCYKLKELFSNTRLNWIVSLHVQESIWNEVNISFIVLEWKVVFEMVIKDQNFFENVLVKCQPEFACRIWLFLHNLTRTGQNYILSTVKQYFVFHPV